MSKFNINHYKKAQWSHVKTEDSANKYCKIKNLQIYSGYEIPTKSFFSKISCGGINYF